MSKLIADVSADFKNYHFAKADALENEDDVKAEQEVLDHHDLNVMELVDRLGTLVEVPLKTKPTTESELLRKGSTKSKGLTERCKANWMIVELTWTFTHCKVSKKGLKI